MKTVSAMCVCVCVCVCVCLLQILVTVHTLYRTHKKTKTYRLKKTVEKKSLAKEEEGEILTWKMD